MAPSFYEDPIERKGKLLIQGVKENNLEAIEQVLNSEPRCINYQDDFGRTAAMYAAMSGRMKLLEYLFKQKGFDSSVIDRFDNSILSYTFWAVDLEFAREVYKLMYPLIDENTPSNK